MNGKVARKGHSTAMAGEFHVMQCLHQMGHQPALTLGNAKTVDILTYSPNEKHYRVSVKAIQSGGKWGIGKESFADEKDLVFVLLLFKDFKSLQVVPDVWVMPAVHAEKIKRPWQHTGWAIYCYVKDLPEIARYKNAWQYLS